MPETTDGRTQLDLSLGLLRIIADKLEAAETEVRCFRHDRRLLMEQCRRDGASLAKLADASGLSVAQVQRICDLSKQRPEGANEWVGKVEGFSNRDLSKDRSE